MMQKNTEKTLLFCSCNSHYGIQNWNFKAALWINIFYFLFEIWRVREAFQFFKIPLCLEPQLVVSVKDCTQYIFLGQFDNVAQTEHAHLKMPLMHLESI